VYPALLLNYFGQGALVLEVPGALAAPFYRLFPAWALYPMVVLATVATVIASQALISGVYSLTQQAVQLGYAPRVRLIHTSREHAGRIYMPTITGFLAIASIAIVLAFRSSDRLGAAYGLAVTITMLATSITYGTVARKRWHWPWWRVAPVVGFFLLFDLSFLVGNLPKLARGGFIPAAIALAIFTLFTTWVDGRKRFARALEALSTPLGEFLREVGDREPNRVDGTAIVLTESTEGIPFALRHEWLRHEILHEQIVLLTIVPERSPRVAVAQRVRIETLSRNLVRVTAHYGFTQTPRVKEILMSCKKQGDPGTFGEPVYFFLSRPRVVPDEGPGAMPGWRRALYVFLLRNATPLTDSLGLPPDRIIEFGVAVPV
jgi:KUP system potassium uptake protein